jgi:hypothetical protein
VGCPICLLPPALRILFASPFVACCCETCCPSLSAVARVPRGALRREIAATLFRQISRSRHPPSSSALRIPAPAPLPALLRRPVSPTPSLASPFADSALPASGPPHLGP